MKSIKTLLRNARAHTIICRVAASYMGFVGRTTRWESVNGAVPQKFWDERKPFLGCFWHGRMMVVAPAWPYGRPIKVLISRHGDGRLISAIIRNLGMDSVEGSTSRGGASALLTIIRELKQGNTIAITPDGPRGPRMRAAPGVVMAAARAGVPVVPMAANVRRCIVVKSWDRFILPLPFGRGMFLFGDPIDVSDAIDAPSIERARLRVEESLNLLSADVDRRMGHTPIEPAAPVAPEAP